MTFGVFPPVLRPVFEFVTPAAAPASNWWAVAGKTCVGAYRAIGVLSQAASYTNLANPGTDDATPGVAPSWASGTGWGLDGTQYLLTSIAAESGMTIICRYSGATSAEWRPVVGDQDSSPRLVIWPAGAGVTYSAGGSLSVSPELTAGVLAVAGQQGYRNGVADGGSIPTASGAWGTLRIGMVDGYGEGFVGDIQAVAIYSDTLTAGEVATVSAAMAALTG